jgi:hypothetical protein
MGLSVKIRRAPLFTKPSGRPIHCPTFLIAEPNAELPWRCKSLETFRIDFTESRSSHLLFQGHAFLQTSVPPALFSFLLGLMKFLERFSTWPFVIYRAARGVFDCGEHLATTRLLATVMP